MSESRSAWGVWNRGSSSGRISREYTKKVTEGVTGSLVEQGADADGIEKVRRGGPSTGKSGAGRPGECQKLLPTRQVLQVQ